MCNTIPFFKGCHCAGPSHLVALTGAHTLGHAHSRYVPCFVPEGTIHLRMSRFIRLFIQI